MAPTTYADKLTRLGNRLDSITTKIAEYESQRDQIMEEIQSIGSSSSSKTTVSGRKQSGSMGDKIYNYLTTDNTGKSRDAIGDKLRIAASRVGVALYHLKEKSKVYQDGNGLWFAQTNAKTTTVEETE